MLSQIKIAWVYNESYDIQNDFMQSRKQQPPCKQFREVRCTKTSDRIPSRGSTKSLGPAAGVGTVSDIVE